MASWTKQLSLSQTWLLAMAAWLLGLATASGWGDEPIASAAVCALVVITWFFTRQWLSSKQWRWAAVLFLAGYSRLVLGGWPTAVVADNLSWSEPQRLTVAAQPAHKNGRQRLRLELASGQAILAWTDDYPRYQQGQILLATCLPSKQPRYDLSWYTVKEGLRGICWNLRVVEQSAGQGHFWLSDTRQYLATKLDGGLRQPAAGLAQAMLLGYDWLVDPRLQQDFTRAGTNHIISISGLHLAVLVVVLSQLLVWLGYSRRYLLWPAALILGLYVCMVGAPAAAARSALMSLVVLAAIFSGRLSRAGPSLLLAACILTAINPYLLRGDIGFQLSFVAVAGLVFGTPVLRSGLDKLLPGSWSWLSLALAAGCAAQLSTWPLVAYHFGQISWIAPLANLIIVPLSELALVAAAACLFFNPAWWWLFWPTQALLDLLIALNAWLAAWPWAASLCAPPPGIFLLVYYACLALVWGHIYRRLDN